MTNNERELIEIIEVLCDTVNGTPCGCDVCPYIDNKIINGQCEVYDTITKVKEGGKNG